ncbi:M23 family metallopeptidase [Blastococcus sp. TF02A-30]|uniref:M23 family metallopeptidase n=1 Tax=Blastococcus sp. TF02A-30 TaxID=2250580 RepID=UPI000DEAA9E5|nr:M23 family metallopeptidase [Blastococcus sp. TF02A-30]RBY93188.1 M23 family peptidase [Blastococcus sp. TF02A-30]
MSRSSAPHVLDRPAVERAALARPLIPRPRAAAAAAEAEPPTEAAPLPESTGSRTRRLRLPQPPGRRAHLWFTALVAGALLAAAPAVLGTGGDEVTVSASDLGLGVATDVSFSGGVDDAGVRRGITEAEAQARLGELAASRAARAPKTVLPVTGRLTTCFCKRWGTMHYGLDLAAPLGTPIYAASDGVVIKAGRASGYGNAVYIQDADGNVHIYGHMRYYNVSAGDIVHAGDQIAKVGNEGQSTGPHLHYEIHRGGMDGRPTDPKVWLAERGVGL